jgi:hypothetical protein
MDSARSPFSIRVSAGPGDRPSLSRLAALEGRPELGGPVVLAEEDGHAVAAVDLESGQAVADPRRSSSGLIALLHVHRLEARLIGALVGG